AKAKWEHVEPAIFGTLLERALSTSDRHKLGAHYTPRAYVERLVLPTVIEPLRLEWSDAQAAALTLAAEDRIDEAVAELRRFHHRLCTVRVLDPACGSGNFLYVTLEHLKRLEGEVLNAMDELGDRQTGLALGGERADAAAGETVDPHNLLGIELNPRAAAIAEVVLWIGYLQWHYRTRGDVHPPQPVIRNFNNIENRDAVLAYDRMEYVLDERGAAVTRWDGKTMKPSPVTGEDVPDDSARVPVERYVNPRKAAWPEADFVVGNPPFIGSKRMRDVLGDGYVDAIQETWPDVPQSTDFVMRWWHHAALLVRNGALQRFGLITTNSLRQAYIRRAVEPHIDGDPPLSLVFAVPDHPWVDSADGAAVRIAMTVGERGRKDGRLVEVAEERAEAEENNDDLVVRLTAKHGRINSDLSVGVDVTNATSLRANADLCSVGMKTIGAAFQIEHQTAESLGLSEVLGLKAHIRPYIGGRDFAGTTRGIYVVDFFGLDSEDVRARFPAAYQHLLERAKPERDHNRNAIFRDRWWVIGHPRQQFRRATAGVSRYVATIETSKHRFFAFVPAEITPDSTLVTIASDDAAHLGCLCSIVHGIWVEANAGSMGVYIGNVRYNKTICFEPFPFPPVTDEQQVRIRTLAEQLDAHRKRQQAAHPDLTLTGMYNVLDKLRSGAVLSAKERTIHEHGLVSVLRQLHDELDAAVLDAYGWSDLLPLLRVAHDNDAADSLLPLAGEGARRADEGARDGIDDESPVPVQALSHALSPVPSPQPSPASGRGSQALARDDAKRAFDEAILERLVALNAERAAEEARGLVRWLRPEFQNPHAFVAPDQPGLDVESPDDTEQAAATAALAFKPQPWPKDAVDQVRAVADLLSASPVPLSQDDIAARFTARGPWKKRLPQLLQMLVALGRAH
ncbi:MAG: class I SAM-dependent DNA methyltransferase, partial [Lysobacter sp.]